MEEGTLTKRIRQRTIDQIHYQSLLQDGIDPILARVVAGRPLSKAGLRGCFSPKLSDLDFPHLMKDMTKAAEKLAQMIVDIRAGGGQKIGIETDHDCDGQTSHAVIYAALTEIFGVPATAIQSYIGHRMKEGYGLSKALMERILADSSRVDLIITADNGSSDEAQIQRLKAEGIEVIVTDHHHLPEEGPPSSAYAVINPSQTDCDFPDALIAGCMVAWLLMAEVCQKLLEKNALPPEALSMKSLLDFVAVGTVADCVSMARSLNNRAVVKYGLHLINQLNRPCWQAIAQLKKGAKITTEDLGFLIGPLLNSDGRLSDAFGSVNFLLSSSFEEAEPWARELLKQNQLRKSIQKTITAEALAEGKQQVEKGRASLVIALKKGHAGVHGISASRIKDEFGRPTVLFSEKEQQPGFWFGSARSIDSVHLRDALARVHALNPSAMVKFGGHRGAAGLTIEKTQEALFSTLFEQAILEQIPFESVGPELLTDGTLPEDYFSLDFVDELMRLDPFGREFEQPVFEGIFEIRAMKWMGAENEHLSLTLAGVQGSGHAFRAVWFNVDPLARALSVGQQIQTAFALVASEFRSKRELNLRLCHVTLADSQ